MTERDAGRRTGPIFLALGLGVAVLALSAAAAVLNYWFGWIGGMVAVAMIGLALALTVLPSLREAILPERAEAWLLLGYIAVPTMLLAAVPLFVPITDARGTPTTPPGTSRVTACLPFPSMFGSEPRPTVYGTELEEARRAQCEREVRRRAIFASVVLALGGTMASVVLRLSWRGRPQ